MDINPEILNRFFKGTYSHKDYLEVKSVFSNLGGRASLKSYLEKHWGEFSAQDMPRGNADQLLHQIHHKIRIEEETGRGYRFIGTFQKVAAVLIIPLLLSFLAFVYLQVNKGAGDIEKQSIGFAEIQCPPGVRTKFELPDGTTGFLNSGSSLRYPVNFTNGRNVTVSGEAYFDVFHDKANPFVVETQNLKVKVLGTRFNVMAYKDDYCEEVILNRGKVEVATQQGQKLDLLEPNQKLVLDIGNGTFKTNEVEAYQYVGWTEGKLIFRNENMLQVAERLGRWYNVDFKIDDKGLVDYAFRATFVDESLKEVLKLMALTAPFTYKELPRDIVDGTFQKRKFVLKIDKERLKSFK